MLLNLQNTAGKATELAYKKLIVAKANAVITGGEKYYTNLAEKLNKGKVATLVKENPLGFENAMDSFITKKQEILEKRYSFKNIEVDPGKIMQVSENLSKRAGENKGLQKLSNIYKYFVEKIRPEIFY